VFAKILFIAFNSDSVIQQTLQDIVIICEGDHRPMNTVESEF